MKRAAVALALVAAAGTCAAAGAHHAVDDAAVQDDGVCRIEGWYSSGQDTQLLHGGTACGFAFGQLGAAVERVRAGGETADTPSLQFKWAREVTPSFAWGWEASLGAAEGRARDTVLTALALATWQPVEDVKLHANVGRDVPAHGSGFARGGVSAEWFPRNDWSLTVERYLDTGTHFARAAVRWALDEEWSLDVSRAQRLSGPGVSNWTLGVSRELRVR